MVTEGRAGQDRLWIVTNQWMGNANEGVIVSAPDEDSAKDAARQALIAHWNAKSGAYWDGQAGAAAKREHLDSYQLGSDMHWWVEEIALPYVGEF